MVTKFRFQALLEIQEKDRDEVGAAVGQANQAVSKIDDQIADVLGKLEVARQEQSVGRTGRLSVDSMLTTSRYALQLQAEHESLLQTRQSLLEEVERRRSLLALAEAEVKKFERLRDKEMEARRAEMLKREQQETDDRVSARYLMQRRKEIDRARMDNEVSETTNGQAR